MATIQTGIFKYIYIFFFFWGGGGGEGGGQEMCYPECQQLFNIASGLWTGGVTSVQCISICLNITFALTKFDGYLMTFV